MHQDGVRGYNGQFIESEDEWFKHFFTDERCYMYGLFLKTKLQAVLVAEQLSNKGCMIWYIAVIPKNTVRDTENNYWHILKIFVKWTVSNGYI